MEQILAEISKLNGVRFKIQDNQIKFLLTTEQWNSIHTNIERLLISMKEINEKINLINVVDASGITIEEAEL